MVNTYAYLMLLAGAAVASVMIAASVPSGPTMMTARTVQARAGQIMVQTPAGQAYLLTSQQP